MDSLQPGQSVAPSSKEKPGETEKASDKEKSQENQTWSFKPDEESEDIPNVHQAKSKDSISWSAAEFVEHKKSINWYLGLIFFGLILAALIFFTTKDKVSTGVVIVVVIVMAFFAARKPRTVGYILDSDGITVGTKFYSYDTFKSYSVIDEGAASSIYLLPLKRFMPALTIYFEPKDEKKIIDMLADRLPFEKRQVDVVENLMHRIRF